MLVRLQENIRLNTLHKRELVRLSIPKTVRVNQDEQDNLVASNHRHTLRVDKVRGRDVCGQGQLDRGHVSLGERARQQTRRSTRQKVLSLLRTEELSSAFCVRSV